VKGVHKVLTLKLAYIVSYKTNFGEVCHKLLTLRENCL